MVCGEVCEGSLDVIVGICLVEGKGWCEVQILMCCFVDVGVDLVGVDVLLLIIGFDGFELWIDDVFVGGEVSESVVCEFQCVVFVLVWVLDCLLSGWLGFVIVLFWGWMG